MARAAGPIGITPLKEAVYRLAERRPSLVRVALALSVVTLVATSAPPRSYYSYSKHVDGPEVALTREVPSRSLRVRLHATALTPSGTPTTDSISGQLVGKIRTSETPAGTASFVGVQCFDVRATDPGELTALTEFSLGIDPSFTGSCDDPTTGSCDAELRVVLTRKDGGTAGGTVLVNWALEFHGQVYKAKGDSESLDLPWEVTVEEP